MEIVIQQIWHQIINRFLRDLRSSNPTQFQEKSIQQSIQEGHQLNVLITDDDEDDRELLREAVFEFSPHLIVSSASDGRALMEILNTSSIPDLIFLDLNMPRQNGFECLTEIRGLPKFKDLPIVIYSTSANPDQIEKTYQLGANLYIQKPDSFSGILTMLQHLFSRTAEQLISKPARSEFVVKV